MKAFTSHSFLVIALISALFVSTPVYAAECQGLTTTPAYLNSEITPYGTSRPSSSSVMNLATHGTYDFYGDSNTLTLYSNFQFYGKTSYYVFVTNKGSSELKVKAKSLLHTYASYAVPANTTISFDIRDMKTDTTFYLTFDGSFMSFSGNIT